MECDTITTDTAPVVSVLRQPVHPRSWGWVWASVSSALQFAVVTGTQSWIPVYEAKALTLPSWCSVIFPVPPATWLIPLWVSSGTSLVTYVPVDLSHSFDWSFWAVIPVWTSLTSLHDPERNLLVTLITELSIQ